MVTLPDNTIVNTEGLTVEEFVKVLELAKHTVVMESANTNLRAEVEKEKKKIGRLP